MLLSGDSLGSVMARIVKGSSYRECSGKEGRACTLDVCSGNGSSVTSEMLTDVFYSPHLAAYEAGYSEQCAGQR
jgi:hypothetical protein